MKQALTRASVKIRWIANVLDLSLTKISELIHNRCEDSVQCNYALIIEFVIR